MQLPKSLLKCCSADSTRYGINHIYVDVETGEAFATDGHLLMVVPITPEESEVSGYIPADALKAAHEPSQKALKGVLLHHASETLVPGKGTFPNPFTPDDMPKFPETDHLLYLAREGMHQITLDAALLLKLADVIRDAEPGPGKPHVTLTYNPKKPDGPLLVTHTQSLCTGLLMPRRPPNP